MYADYSYYTESFGGKSLSKEEFPVYARRASDFLDYITRRRLVDNLPPGETDLGRVKRACCAVADKLLAIDRRKAKLEENGAVKSISSGGESMSFELSEVDRAIIGGEKETNQFLYNVAKVYLSLTQDKDGNYYLYWGL